MMSVPPSRAQSEVFSASQYGAPVVTQPEKPRRINYFIIPVFVLEVIGLACLWALWYYLRTFWCRDWHLMKPDYAPDEFILYVSPEVLYSVCFVLPPLVIFGGEVMFWLFSTRPRKTVYANCYECKVHLFTRRLFRFVSVFMFGAVIVGIFIDSIKLITGYQRPYFFNVCKPNYTACINYPGLPFEHPVLERNPRSVCSPQALEAELRTAWLTFPSFYAGLSSFSACFMSCYVHYMISLRGAPLLRPSLIAGFTGMCLIASFSRIQGYKNHWVDIWVGWCIGICWAFYLCYNVLAFQEVYKMEEERVEIIEEQQQRPVAPFFQWFKLPRVQPVKESTYSVYTNEESPPLPPQQMRHRARDTNKTYEVTTTTESFQRTISPPQQGVSQRIDY